MKMDDLQKEYEELLKLIDETARGLEEKLKNNELTKYEYDELKSLDIDYDKKKDSVELFKEFYIKKRPIKCSELLLDIYNKHKTNFRKAVLLSECFPDPLGFKYNQEVHEFNILIIKRALNLAVLEGYPEEVLKELKQLYLALVFFYHSNLKNTEKLNKCEFMNFSLSEQIRMIFIFLQDQNRLEQELKEKELKRQGFFTGMESAISNKSPEMNPNMLVSYQDNFEGVLEGFDILIRYLYFKKSKDYKNKIIPEHGDITHIKIPSFELITYLSTQRNILIKTWEKFKYSQWNVIKTLIDTQETFVFSPKFENEYREYIIAGNRKQYRLMSNLFKSENIENVIESQEIISKISDKINKEEIKTLFSTSKKDYFCAIKNYQSVINAYKSNMHPYYLELNIDGLKVEDIFKGFELLNVLAECYKQAIYKNFDQEDNAWYKYLCPIIPIEYFVKSLSEYYSFTKEYSLKLINCFTFKPKIKGESDIFSRPLILVNSENIVFCPVLIQQMNLERIIEMLLSNFKVNIAPIGTDFENSMRLNLSYVNGIKVNTSKIEFFASDGRNIEFDFIATFDDNLLLWEFKAMTAPYSSKKHLECKKTIMEGIEQIERRSRIIKTDWRKIKELANIELPEEPFSDDKIIKLVGTNIFDFTTLVYREDIRVVDESTLLKFFVNPKVKVMRSDNKVISSNSLWRNSVPTIDEFKQYLENPITTSIYNGCIEAFPKVFPIFEDDYPFVIIDQILTNNPYEKAIESVIKFQKENSINKKSKSKRKKIKRKRRNNF